MNPRERLQAWLETSDEFVYPGFDAELRSVLSANAGYERIIAEQRREAVADYKRELAKELRKRLMQSGEMGAAAIIDDIADDLEDDSL